MTLKFGWTIPPRMESLRFLSPAKINLSLRILNRREDDFHNLLMVMEKVSLFDEIFLEKIPTGIELTVHGPWSIVPSPIEKNLAYRAAKILQEVSDTYRGVRIGLTKKIPMGGGLGGGSSNAATVLKGLNELWGLNLPPEKLVKIGVRLGADIPFFIYDGPALVGGIGDLIKPLKKIAKLWIILINPGVPVSTPWAYKTWDANASIEGRTKQPRSGVEGEAPTALPLEGALPAPMKRLTQENQNVRRLSTFEEVLQVLHNDFEDVIFPEFPEIQKAKETLVKAGARGTLMSGSGSTVFGLFETKPARDKAITKIRKKAAWQVFTAENN
ncbi:MAG: 4-(cytidine 5'-diphospho)-2-C-methyl-D-erythritol kinase [Deltaproteobacteria bacterium]|nr:4-(cytidine 5'-diphospho)-2-C-methyl-D-erythritol kinase [Deltaproteobacteria bacterium]